MAKRKKSPDQMLLPFGQPSELALALRSIDWRVTGMSEHCWRQVREILIAVAYCSGSEGCAARRDKLMQLANDNRDNQSPEVSNQRTFDRRHKQAVDSGLLFLTKRYRRTALRSINVKAVNQLVAETRKAAEQKRENHHSRAQKTVSIPVASHCHVSVDSTVNFSGGSITKLTNNNSKQLKLTKLTGRQTTKENSPRPSKLGTVDYAAAEQATRYFPEFGRSKARDWDLLVKCVWLSRNVLNEHWLHNALEACRHTPRRQGCNRWQLFWTTINNPTPVTKYLARVEVPPEFQRPLQRDRRLCEVGDE